MPWFKEAMKDAAKRRYAPGRCQATYNPEISEWGNLIAQTAMIEGFNPLMRTRGSETSQYPKEKRPNRISLVAASEKEEAQTQPLIQVLIKRGLN